MFLIKNGRCGLSDKEKETLFLSVAFDPDSQPSSHNYYHHQDPTLSTLCALLSYSLHTVYHKVRSF
jgi:hypothetical protein